MKRSRGTSIDATAVVTSALTPFRLSRDTNEQFVVDTISPLLRQLVDLSNNAVSGLKEDAETLSLRHANLFAIPVPVLPFLSQGHREVVSVELRRGEDWSTRAPLEVSAVPGVQFPHAPYTPMHLPLHYAALSGDVTAALRLLDKMPSDGVRTRDEWGTEAAALALFHGHRVLYALLTWRSLHWPALAVCQLLRARMELESNLIDAEMFWSVRESVHEFVHDALHDIRYRPIKYQTSCVAHSDRGPLAIMLLPEIPYTEHESAAPVRASSTSVHRRGSLDVLLQAIEVISE